MTTSTDTRRRAIEEARRTPTKNELPSATRAGVVVLLNQLPADCIDLQTTCKQAHCNVKGPNFHQLHTLFDEVNGESASTLT
jgi:DNA-binding ferritin-like protein